VKTVALQSHLSEIQPKRVDAQPGS